MGSYGRNSRLRGVGSLSLQQKFSPFGSKMKDFENGHENNPKRSGGISRHKAGLDYAQGNQDQRYNRAGETQVEAGIEQMVFIFEQFQFDPRLHPLTADFRQFDQASRVNQCLKHEKQQQRQ